MCGIAGFIDFKNSSSLTVVEKMTDTLYHRGPDGAGYEFIQENSYQIGFGHRRLAIIDLTELGKQPMFFDNCWITFNGEIYNYKEIKKELLDLGHQFVSDSDTEVILHAYKQWGINCVHRFIGMFAFVIYDKINEKIILLRDRTGIKPLNYYIDSETILFASELKAFHEHPSFKKELNLAAVSAFMQYGNVPGELSIFNNCF